MAKHYQSVTKIKRPLKQKEITAPNRLKQEFKIQYLHLWRFQWINIPDCERVNGTKTPTAYNGINKLV